jgi:hypothetical protein
MRVWSQRIAVHAIDSPGTSLGPPAHLRLLALALIQASGHDLCGYDLQAGGCRRHHQLKQHPRWKLTQTRPGHFTWTTPTGRTYTTAPDTQPV